MLISLAFMELYATAYYMVRYLPLIHLLFSMRYAVFQTFLKNVHMEHTFVAFLLKLYMELVF